jgi:hypothetical protein
MKNKNQKQNNSKTKLEENIWANNPDNPGDVIPPTEAKTAEGFVFGEIPKHSNFNYTMNKFNTFSVHNYESGIPRWDSTTSYNKGSCTIHDDGTHTHIYVSDVDNNQSEPNSTTPGNWRIVKKFHLNDVLDVIIENLENDQILQLRDIPEMPLFKVWTNVDKNSILGIDDLNDTYGTNKSGSFLIRTDIPGQGKIWAKKVFSDIMNNFDLEDFSDIDSTGITNNDILTVNNSKWVATDPNNANIQKFVIWIIYDITKTCII